jgi:U32 family peptidase
MTPGTRSGNPRLLAPAGGPEAVSAVLAAGADAVFAGIRGWSREGPRAGLDLRDASRAAAACRLAGAEFHVALNTVPSTAEIPAFLETVRRLSGDGVDAVILNDPGIVALVRREFPRMRICASVGLSTLNPDDALFYREIGADAVVLPTAVPPDEIPAIKARSGLAVEVFVRCRPEVLLHGKCGLSAYVRESAAPAGRPDAARAGPVSSAKRGGRCFLVCRTYPLSREPHAIDEDLVPWIRAGVDAFKVQGRELPSNHLGGLVRSLRERLDAALAQVS